MKPPSPSPIGMGEGIFRGKEFYPRPLAGEGRVRVRSVQRNVVLSKEPRRTRSWLARRECHSGSEYLAHSRQRPQRGHFASERGTFGVLARDRSEFCDIDTKVCAQLGWPPTENGQPFSEIDHCKSPNEKARQQETSKKSATNSIEPAQEAASKRHGSA
jgi:hypothetical protein